MGHGDYCQKWASALAVNATRNVTVALTGRLVGGYCQKWAGESSSVRVGRVFLTRILSLREGGKTAGGVNLAARLGHTWRHCNGRRIASLIKSSDRLQFESNPVDGGLPSTADTSQCNLQNKLRGSSICRARARRSHTIRDTVGAVAQHGLHFVVNRSGRRHWDRTRACLYECLSRVVLIG